MKSVSDYAQAKGQIAAMRWWIGLSQNEQRLWLKWIENNGAPFDFWADSLVHAWTEWKFFMLDFPMDETP